MATPKTVQNERTMARRLVVMEQYLKGTNQYQLAKLHGVSQPQISADLAWVRKQWIANTVMLMDEAKAKELARIDSLELNYWDEWDRSKLGRTKKRVFKSARQAPNGGADDDGTQPAAGTVRTAEEWEESEELFGDKKYLEGVQWCIEQRCKILGLYAPTKQELTGKGGEALLIRVDK